MRFYNCLTKCAADGYPYSMEETTRLLARFLDADGKITALPKKRPARMLVLARLAEKFEPSRDYTEREVNRIIDAWHTFGDLFLLRREMIEAGVLCRTRDGSRYWRDAPDKADAPPLQ